jgi:hypothetical protein
MMVFDDLIIRKTDDNKFYMEWVFLPIPVVVDPLDPPVPVETVDDYIFKVKVSESPDFGFEYIQELVIIPPDTIGTWEDVVVDGAGATGFLWPEPQLNFNRHFYFKIEAFLKTDPSIVTNSMTQHIAGRPDGITMSITAIEQMLYRNYYGAPAKVYKKKITAGRCPECYNPYTETLDKSTCHSCNGTGYLDSYYDAASIQMSFEYGNKTQQAGQTQTVTQDQMSARASNIPIVRPGDLILNTDTGERFLVNNPVQYTQLPRVRRSANELSQKPYVVSQILSLKRLASTDPEYKVKI